jgi:hypothetical protein
VHILRLRILLRIVVEAIRMERVRMMVTTGR